MKPLKTVMISSLHSWTKDSWLLAGNGELLSLQATVQAFVLNMIR